MRNASDADDKSPHERFTDLGKQIMAVPKSEVDKREAKWQKRKIANRKKKR